MQEPALTISDPFAPVVPPPGVDQADADIVALLLADKRSEQTRRAYAADLRDFFGAGADARTVGEFCALAPALVARRLATYKADLIGRGLAEATINRRLAAVRSLLKTARRLGWAQTDGRGLVDGERVQAYRDTRGVDAATLRRLLRLPDERHGAGMPAALRDTALLRLLCENALRRAEVCALDATDFEAAARRVYIKGKGRGTQREPITVSTATCAALSAHLEAQTEWWPESAGDGGDAPLFRNRHRGEGWRGRRLTPGSLYEIVREYGERLGVSLAPHKLRHSAITAALEATNGDVRAVQKLSRHRRLDTLMLYDDSRRDRQGEVTDLLSSLL